MLRDIFNYFKMFFNLRVTPLRSVVLINVYQVTQQYEEDPEQTQADGHISVE